VIKATYLVGQLLIVSARAPDTTIQPISARHVSGWDRSVRR
jgi:hypothetical protein